ncbi:MAG TPA: hypothetical protein VFF47_05020 [Nitrospirota bacterium]|nr:hypothetical protein [Nitrospirota bacterium]
MGTQKIGTVLNQTLTGLANNIPLKLGREEESKGRHGYTTMKTNSNKELQPHHNKVIDARRGGEEVQFGEIHISYDRMLSEFSPKTLIHEATHKYAATHDYWIYKDDGLTPDGNGKTFIEEKLLKSSALNNADSYAWFFIMLAKPK